MGIRARLVEGAPVIIGDKKLTPVVRVISCNRRQAVVRQGNTSGFGFAAAWLWPTAVIEETADGRRRIPVRDETGQTMLALLVIALLVPLALSLLVRLVRGKERKRD